MNLTASVGARLMSRLMSVGTMTIHELAGDYDTSLLSFFRGMMLILRQNSWLVLVGICYAGGGGKTRAHT